MNETNRRTHRRRGGTTLMERVKKSSPEHAARISKLAATFTLECPIRPATDAEPTTKRLP